MAKDITFSLMPASLMEILIRGNIVKEEKIACVFTGELVLIRREGSEIKEIDFSPDSLQEIKTATHAERYLVEDLDPFSF